MSRVNIIAVCVAAACIVTSAAYAQDGGATVPPVDATDFVLSPELQVWQGLYKADMNARYHSAKAAQLGSRWTLVRAGLTVASILTVIIGLQHTKYLKKHPQTELGLKWAGYAGLLVSVALLYFPWGEQATKHATLAQQWTGLMGEWRDLRAELESIEKDTVLIRTKALLAYERTIETTEPPVDKEALDRAQDDVDREFGVGEFAKQATAQPGPVRR